MSVSSTMISHSITDRSATVMITVGWKLCAPITISPSSLARLVMTPAIGAITVVFSKLSRLEVRKASCCAIWSRIDSAAAVLIRTPRARLVEDLVRDELLSVGALGALEAELLDLEIGDRPLQVRAAGAEGGLALLDVPPRSASSRCGRAPGRAPLHRLPAPACG